jgi:hypothetical protein
MNLNIQTDLPPQVYIAPPRYDDEVPTQPSTPTNANIQQSNEAPRLTRQNARRPEYYEENETINTYSPIRRNLFNDDDDDDNNDNEGNNNDNNNIDEAYFYLMRNAPRRPIRMSTRGRQPYPTEINSEGFKVQFGKNKICSQKKFIKNYMKLGNSLNKALMKYNKAIMHY